MCIQSGLDCTASRARIRRPLPSCNGRFTSLSHCLCAGCCVTCPSGYGPHTTRVQAPPAMPPWGLCSCTASTQTNGTCRAVSLTNPTMPTRTRSRTDSASAAAQRRLLRRPQRAVLRRSMCRCTRATRKPRAHQHLHLHQTVIRVTSSNSRSKMLFGLAPGLPLRASLR